MKIAAGMMFLLAGSALAQSDDGLTARQIFDAGIKAPAPRPVAPPKNTPPPKVKPLDPVVTAPVVKRPADPVASSTPKAPDGVTHMQPVSYAPLALRYTILQKKGNAFEEVDADTEFHSGDRIRVKVEANGPSYLYIVMGGSSGQWKVLFPSKEIDGGNNKVGPGHAFTIPPDNDPPFYFDETAGVEKVSLILSRSPEPDLEKLIYAAGDPTRGGDRPKLMIAENRTIEGGVFGGVRDKLLSRDLVFEKNDGPAADGKQEKAVYAATRDKSSDARLFVDLKLTHK